MKKLSLKQIDIRKITKFISKDLWRMPLDDLGKGMKFLVNALKTIVLAIKGFNDNDINMRANSLTYSMMFAIVPILALIFAVARGFGFEEVVQNFLEDSFLKDYGIVDTIMGFVQRYLETAQGGAFIGVGIFILLWAVYSFFRNVESSFNKIWQVQKSRSYVRQFTNYLTILILVPILIIASTGISVLFNSREAAAGLVALVHINNIILKLIPWVTSWLIFILMYKTIPNTKVKWTATFFPGILTGTLVQALQAGSVYIIVFLSRTSVVYGTFAAIPLLLTWLQWTCLLILLGAQMSYAIQTKGDFDFEHERETMSRRYKDCLTLYICHMIVKRFEFGEEPLSAEEISRITTVPLRIVNQLIARLADVHILSPLASESEKEEQRYQPAIDINQLTVGMVFHRLDAQGAEGFVTRNRKVPADLRKFWEMWAAMRQTNSGVAGMLVKDMMNTSFAASAATVVTQETPAK